MSHAAFWKAVCAEPDDDTPRLVYADWLDEQGEAERAEFVRAQIELALLDPWSERAVELRIRERVLLQARRESWLDQLPKWVNRSAVTFHRGMPHGFVVTAREYLKNAGGVAKNTPLQEVTFTGIDANSAEQLAALPHLVRMRVLRCPGGSWAAWETVLGSPHLTDLRCLGLTDESRAALPLDTFRDVLALPAVRGLRRFELYVSGPLAGASDVLGAVADAPFTDLSELTATVTDGDPRRIADFLAKPVAAGLKSFRSDRNLDARALADLSRVPELSRLKALEISLAPEITSELGAAFDTPPLRHVESLTMWGCPGAGLRALAASPLGTRLRVLRLKGSSAALPDYREAFAPGRFANLWELELPAWPGRWSGDPPFAAVADAKGLENLRHLVLGGYAWNPPNLSLDPFAARASLPNLRCVTVPPWFEKTLHDPQKRAAFAAKYASRFAVIVA